MHKHFLALVSFLLVACAAAARAEVTGSDAEYAGLAHFKITTPAATYYFEKSGAGLSRPIDPDGHDWLSFDPTPGTGAGGEYRGFPNAVHQQAGNYFHPRNQATDASKVRIAHQAPERVTIVAEASNGLWESRYDFFDTHCVFTMTKIPSDKKYWVLYEGTPGGQFDISDWWMTSAIATQQSMSQNHDGDLLSPEWIAFGDARLRRALFLLHYDDDTHPDRFYAMQSKMTVFGFGRVGTNKFLESPGQSFAIGFLETTDHAAIGKAMKQLRASRSQPRGE